MDHKLFLAIKIDLDKSLQEKYFYLKKLLSQQRVKFYTLDQLMLVIRYLGNIPSEFISEFNGLIGPIITSQPKLLITIDGIDIYPYDVMPRVLWLRVREDKNLSAFVRKIEKIVKDFSGHEEIFAFYPHITFARIRYLKNTKLLSKIKQFSDIEPVNIEVNYIHLIENIKTNKGNIYKTRNKFMLMD